MWRCPAGYQPLQTNVVLLLLETLLSTLALLGGFPPPPHPPLPLQFGLSTLLVVDESRAGVPVAFIVHSRETEALFVDALRAFSVRMKEHHPTWLPSCFIVDDCTAVINAIM